MPPISINGDEIERGKTSKLLGVHLSHDLKWHTHVDEIVKATAKKIHLVSQLKQARVSVEDIVRIFVSVVRPKLEYACPVWHTSLTEENSDLNESIQKRVIRMLSPNIS